MKFSPKKEKEKKIEIEQKESTIKSKEFNQRNLYEKDKKKKERNGINFLFEIEHHISLDKIILESMIYSKSIE